MKRILLFLLFFLWVSSVEATQYFVSPTGTTGNCLSTGTACSIATVWAKPLTGGDVVNMMDGTYQGDNYMINTVTRGSGLFGSLGAYITFKAINPGKVLIDGQNSRKPIWIEKASRYVIVDGVNAAHGDPSSDGIIYISCDGTTCPLGGQTTHDIIIRNVVAWDANPTERGYIFETGNGVQDVLFEDVAGFGIGRVIMGVFGYTDRVTYRRAFALWMRNRDNAPPYGNAPGGPSAPFQTTYHSADDTYENVIGTSNWLGVGATWVDPNPGIVIGGGTGGFQDSRASDLPGAVITGSIFYLLNSQNQSYPGNQLGQTEFNNSTDCPLPCPKRDWVTENSVFYNERSGGIPFVWSNPPGTCTNCVVRNTTEIASAPSNIGSKWISSNRQQATSLAGINIWTNTTTGANICYQTVNRKITNTPLWPWPMDARIQAALSTAGYAASFPATTVTAQMQQIFGTIPAACTTGAVAGPTVSIKAPASTPTFTAVQGSNANITFSGTAQSNGGSGLQVTYSCDRCGAVDSQQGWGTSLVGQSVSGSQTAWSQTLMMRSGINRITFTVNDSTNTPASATIAVTYPPSYPGDTLAGAWGFEETSGQAVDSSGNSNNGTLANGATRTASGHAATRAVIYDGSKNQYTSVADSNSLDFTQGFTVSAWVNPSHTGTTYETVAAKNYYIVLYSSTDGSLTGCATGSPAVYVKVNGSVPGEAWACAPPLTANVWTHLAGTYDNATLKFYVNGGPPTTASISGYMEPSTGTFTIATSIPAGGSPSDFFSGTIDEVRVRPYAVQLAGVNNKVPGGACDRAEADNVKTASVIGDMNCPVIGAVVPPIVNMPASPSGLQTGALSGIMQFGTK